MRRTIKLAAVVLAAAAVGVVAYDRSQSRDTAVWPDAAALQSASVTKTGGYRIDAPPRTVIELGRNRSGCTLTSALPAQAVCDIAVAFPDVGLNGTVTFVGSTDVPTAPGLSIDLGN